MSKKRVLRSWIAKAMAAFVLVQGVILSAHAAQHAFQGASEQSLEAPCDLCVVYHTGSTAILSDEVTLPRLGSAVFKEDVRAEGISTAPVFRFLARGPPASALA